MPDQSDTKPRRPFLTRRKLIVGGGLAGSAMVVGAGIANIDTLLSLGAEGPETQDFGPFIRIAADNSVTIVNKHQEMGQGIHAGLAAIVAEELDADWSKVRIEAAPANMKLYGNTTARIQGTFGSNGIANSWDQLRQAGAAARYMLVQAAADLWQVSAGSLTVKDGIITDPLTGRTAPFSALLARAAQIKPPENLPLKDPKQFTLIGTERVRRKDSRAKITGAERYTQDIQLNDMMVAMVAHSPRFGGKVLSFDDSEARKIAGIVDVFEIPSGVAVVATDTYTAKRGRDALKVDWDDEKAEMRSSEDLFKFYRDTAQGKTNIKGDHFQKSGNPEGAFEGDLLEITYDLPYLAHAPMEPMNCVALVDGRSVKLITASQIQTMDQINTARVVGCLPGSVEIETLPAGGSFGRRGVMSSDYIVECVHIAKHVGGGRPVKLIWTREDDMMGGYYRPMSHQRLWIKSGADGFASAWRHHTVVQSLTPVGPNTPGVEGIHGSPYLAATTVVDGKVFTPQLAIPPGFWRSVGASHSAMVMEHTVDQLARRAGRDPVDYRRTIYINTHKTRWLSVLNLAAEKAGWGKPLEAGWARGVAVCECFGTVVAQIAEVSLIDDKPRVRRVVAAVDCGIAVAPDQIRAQMEGGICFGLSAALYGGVTLEGGIVQTTNFDTAPVLRIDEAPVIETHIVPSGNPPTGMGEPGVPLMAPALANALLALTGQPTLSLPFVKS
ncbi:xanthine dehydrogenase family protein molybdopterin-binding subunit [Asticcacaulis endophyticus]|uniref:Isoquinoline 1-oxidoreductase subunit beta n=1 Tax=Asticcacaulis endophyticus TaxID=1395890 RepID=A0A918Q928_9CAUL|nr:molybdopterin cofactor-binding domain-containing protein [Asticcacaulis endophyticus]GGZ35480.1 isoquinoline 1-oxidoreductase subunit beta [Asticcacaulis endophyticus]